MIGASLFMTVGVLAAQITISEVSAERDAGRLTITVKGDAMIDPEAASAKLGEGNLYLFIRDARVREANRAWRNGAAEGAEDIRAHRHRQKVELAVPLGSSGCQGTVDIEKAPGGLRALVECNEAPGPAAGRAARPRAAASKGEAKTEVKTEAKSEVKSERAEPAAAPAAAPSPSIVTVTSESRTAARAEPKALAPQRLREREAAELKAKLALEPSPTPTPAPMPVAKANQDGEKQEAPKAVAATARAAGVKATRESASAPVLPAVGLVVTAPAPGAGWAAALSNSADRGTPASGVVATAEPDARNKILPGSSSASGAESSGGVALAGLALLAIAGAAFFFSRRRALVSRHIRIIETASLGPKRALIVARVGDATMILGSSEAGITLLQTLPDGRGAEGLGLPEGVASAFAAAATTTTTTTAGPAAATVVDAGPAHAPIAAAPATGVGDIKIDVQEPMVGIGLPAAPSLDSDGAQPVGQAGLLARLFRRGKPANDPHSPAPRFEDLLEDSFEDQELRRKLALGLSGRVR